MPGYGRFAQGNPDGLTWILTIDADQTRRLVSEDVAVTKDGDRIGAGYGLALDEIKDTFSGLSTGVVAFAVPDEVDDVGAWLADLAAGAAEVAICPYVDGVAAWEDRIVLRYGTIEDVEYSHADGVVTVTIVGNETEDTSDLCPLVIDDRSWPQADASAYGKRHPFVYGVPGSYEYSSWTNRDGYTVIEYNESGFATGIRTVITSVSYSSGATPAIPVDMSPETLQLAPGETVEEKWASFLLIADGWIPDTVTEVELWASGQTGNGWLTSRSGVIKRTSDGRGRNVTLLKIKALNSAFRTGGKWWIGWVGGAPRTGALGQLVIEVLQRSSVRIDWASVRAAAQYLDRYTIGGFVSDPISATAWVKDRVERFGVRTRWGTDGFQLVVTDPTWMQLPVARIDAEDKAVGPLRFVPSNLDRVTVEWTDEGAAETARRSMTTDLYVVRTRPSPRPGDASDTVKAPEVWDLSTAAAVGTLALIQRSSYREVTVLTDQWWVHAGDFVEFTWEALGIIRETWLVVESVFTTDKYKPVVLRKYDIPQVRIPVERPEQYGYDISIDAGVGDPDGGNPQGPG